MILRQAALADFGRLMVFYRVNASKELPAPSLRVLDDTLEEGRLLVVEDGDEILAAAAVFNFSRRSAPHYVGELSGARVTPALGGFDPVPMQRLLIAARVAGFVALSPATTAAPASLITIVKAGNDRSIRNVTAAGFRPLATKPDWFVYEELDWFGSVVGDEWSYFVADDGTVRQAVADLEAVGVLGAGMATLTRVERGTGEARTVTVRVDLPGLTLAQEDLRATAAAGSFGLTAPPPEP